MTASNGYDKRAAEFAAQAHWDARAEAVGCPLCGVIVHPDNLQRHYEMEHEDEPHLHVLRGETVDTQLVVVHPTTALMTREEARVCADAIKAELGNLRRLVFDLHNRQGWAALGYSSWRECVNTEFNFHQSTLYRLLDAGIIENNISPIGENNNSIIPEWQLRPLARLEPDEQRIVWQVVEQTAPGGKVTAAHVKSVVNVFRDVVATGAIDSGEGDEIAVSDVVKAAITEETYERMKRQEAHIVERQAERERKETAKAAREAVKTAVPEGWNAQKAWKLYQGHFFEVCKPFESGSFDCLITDPPYGREHLDLYKGLGIVAARLLKPGGSLICMTGQSYLSEVMNALGKHLTYHWTLAYLTFGGSPTIWPRNVNNFWKPVLWFVNGVYDGEMQSDIVRSASAEKRFHEWQQSESGMAELVDRFTNPGEIILDTFCGAATTGVVAVKMHRRFVGIDNDERAVAAAGERLLDV